MQNLNRSPNNGDPPYSRGAACPRPIEDPYPTDGDPPYSRGAACPRPTPGPHPNNGNPPYRRGAACPRPIEDPRPVPGPHPIEDPRPAGGDHLRPTPGPHPTEDPRLIEDPRPIHGPRPIEDPRPVPGPHPIEDPRPAGGSHPTENPRHIDGDHLRPNNDDHKDRPFGRVLPFSIADQQEHIDRSEALLGAMSPASLPVLYWSQAEPEGLVLGYSQKQDVLNPTALANLQLSIYHRRAGGTAVLVGPHLLSLDVVLPPGHPFVIPDIVESYRWFGEAWVAALAQLGIATRTVSTQEAHAQRALLKQNESRARELILHRACFGSLSPYEVVVGQRKVVGLDMIRRRVGSLLQAGILLHWEIGKLAELLGHTPQEQALLGNGLLERAVGIDTLAGRVVTAEEIIAAFERVIFSL